MILVAAVLALALLTGFYLLVAGIVWFYLRMLHILVSSPRVMETLDWSGYLQLGILGFALAVMVRSVITASGPPAARPDSVAVSEEQAPGLWVLVRGVTARFGIAAPAEIRLTGEPNAAVSERARLLGLLRGPRTLYLGVPLLVGLTTDELRAVLCHEFGHCARGHTRLSAVTYRGHAAIGAVRRDLIDRTKVAPWLYGFAFLLVRGLLALYALGYDLVSLAVRRRQEVDADRAAAAVTGATVLADALRSADATAVAWADFRARFVAPAARRAVLPVEEFSPFGAMLADPGYRERVARRRANPPEGGGWRDSHPPLRRRLDRLARLPGSPVRPPEDPGELLADPAALLPSVTPRATRPARRLEWREWLDDIAEHHARAAAAMAPVEPVTLASVLELVAGGSRVSFDAVYAAVGQALVAAGTARWSVPWNGTRALVDADEITELVRLAVDDRTVVPRLREALVAAGVDDVLTRQPTDTLTRPRGALPGQAV
ncbi:M48 family metalloprotease [Actinokineospora auranticolor]|uniref:Zn-dependent protease with chaperone function n=1 Tax=Actinokineospora auranticolor TaxID=155976 RepID=A0A2S6GEQ8_9PSEU|nr:M48 family metallopeptidase [Actinokineospora auranticolor]PPK63692.1 Zn-dependent protease with chaperone function [Actinokineospora auranticolor]